MFPFEGSMTKRSFFPDEYVVTRYARVALGLIATSWPAKELPAEIERMMLGLLGLLTLTSCSWFVVSFVATYAVLPVTITRMPVPAIPTCPIILGLEIDDKFTT